MELNKLAIIGYGSMGSIHHKSIIENRSTTLDAVFDIKNLNVSLSKEIKQFNDYKKFLDYLSTSQVAGVIISSPNKYHYKHASDILTLKIPVLIEKPITSSIQEMNKLINLAKNNNTVLRCGLIEIYNPVISELRKLKLNNIKSIHINRHSPRISNDRYLGDVIQDLLLHDISLIYYLFNPKKIEIIGSNKIKIKNTVETLELLLKIDNNISVFISTSRESQVKKRNIEIMDKNSVYMIDLIEKIIHVTQKGSTKSKVGSVTHSNKNFKIEPLDRPETAKVQLNSFIENIKLKKLDFDHIDIIKKSHEFIFQI